MKRITAIAFAFVALVAWTLPAAADIKFGGQYRLRGEGRENQKFNDQGSDRNLSFYGQRVRLWAIATPTDDVTVKITLQNTATWGENGAWDNCSGTGADCGGPVLSGSGYSNSNNDQEMEVALHEAYVQINKFLGYPVALKVGRQELVYGDERLVGAFGWSNNGRSFEAIKFMYATNSYSLDVWTSKIRENNGVWSNGSNGGTSAGDNDQDFYGAYLTVKTIPNNTLDLYVLWLRDGSTNAMISSNTTPSGIDGVQNLYTYGARLAGAYEGIDYTFELPIQRGTIPTGGGDYDISAWAFAAKFGYTIPNAPYGLRIGAEYDTASGDDDALDKDLETFSNLFPTNHDKMGFMDQQAWRNMKAWNLNVSANLTPKLSARLDFWNFGLKDEADGWYGAGQWNNTPTGSLRTADATLDDKLGSEFDLTLNYKYNSAVGIQAGLSKFLTDSRIDDAVGSNVEDQLWSYIQLTANF